MSSQKTIVAELVARLGATGLVLEEAARHDLLEEFWAAVPNGTWLLDCARAAGVEHERLVRAALACARSVVGELDSLPEELERSLQRLEGGDPVSSAEARSIRERAFSFADGYSPHDPFFSFAHAVAHLATGLSDTSALCTASSLLNSAAVRVVDWDREDQYDRAHEPRADVVRAHISCATFRRACAARPELAPLLEDPR